MHNLAIKADESTVYQELGTIVRAAGDEWTVETGSGTWEARRAVSCLVAPAIRDLVLIAAAADGSAWILAVLERPEAGDTRLEVEGDLTLSLRTGRFTVAAQSGVTLASGGDVSIAAPGVRVNADDSTVAVGRLAFLGSLVRTEIEQLKTVAASCESVIDRLVHRVKRSYRFVEESDQLRAGRIDFRASQNVNLHGKNALLTAEGLVKLDGEQVHIG